MKKFSVLLFALALLTVLTGCIRANPARIPVEQGAKVEQGTISTDINADFIGEEKAKQIALEKAGVDPADAVFERIELDRDDGIWQYEIDFRNGRTEYDVDVNAQNGDIVVFEMDYDD